MTRNDPQLMHSMRPASRRLHRRLALSAAPLCANTPCRPRAAMTGRSTATVQGHGMFGLLAAELRIAELEKELTEAREAACIDPLTGALNRRGFDRAGQRELARSRRRGVSFSVAHIDLDDFKHLNDALGHQAGDRALVRLVESFHQSMRPSDVLCRFGGEEFVLLLPDTSLHDAVAAVSRFLWAFSAQVIPGTDCTMTFSAGVVVSGIDESLEDVIQRADTATYAAKRAGKNRVVTC